MGYHLVTAGTRQPSWINEGFAQYNKRLPKPYRLNLIEVQISKRSGNANADKLRQQDSDRLWAALPNNAYVIALQIKGKTWSTETLAHNMSQWSLQGKEITFVIGGPDGIDPDHLQQAQLSWSLSTLTLPHGLVRVLVAEQIYRAWSLNNAHPYHR